MSSEQTTVGELVKQDRVIVAECQDCGHARGLGPEAMLRFDPSTPLSEVPKRLVCGACKSKLIICMAQG